MAADGNILVEDLVDWMKTVEYRLQTGVRDRGQGKLYAVLDQFPEGSGVFFFRDSEKKVRYIGKTTTETSNLRKAAELAIDLGKDFGATNADYYTCGDQFLTDAFYGRAVKEYDPSNNKEDRYGL